MGIGIPTQKTYSRLLKQVACGWTNCFWCSWPILVSLFQASGPPKWVSPEEGEMGGGSGGRWSVGCFDGTMQGRAPFVAHGPPKSCPSSS